MTTRRGLLLGLGVIIAAPAIVRFDNIMPVRALAPELLAVTGPDRKQLLVWWCEPPCLSATMQKWEDCLAAVKTAPDNALFKDHVLERAEYWMEVKRQRGIIAQKKGCHTHMPQLFRRMLALKKDAGAQALRPLIV